MATLDSWTAWYNAVIAAGADAALASIGRQVVRDYFQHGYDQREARGEGPFLGAPRHHEMMIALCVQKHQLARAVFIEALAQDGSEEDDASEDLYLAEGYYGALAGQPRPALSLLDDDSDQKMKDWYRIVYSLDGCTWDLYRGL